MHCPTTRSFLHLSALHFFLSLFLSTNQQERFIRTLLLFRALARRKTSVQFFSKRCAHVVVIFTRISLPLSLPLFLSPFLPLLACEEVNYEPCTLINSFFEIFSSIKNWATFLRWSPWSWMISPSSESSTIVPLQLNFFLHSFKMIFLLILGLIPCNVVKDFLPFLCCVRMWMYLSWTESALIFSAFSFFFFLSSESSRSSWFNKSAWFANGSIPVVVFNCYAA